MTTDTDIIDEAALAGIDRDCERAEIARRQAESRAHARRIEADSAAQHVADLAAVRKFAASHLGMPWADALAEVETDLEQAVRVANEAQADVEKHREWVRDLEGHRRVLERRVLDLHNQEADGT